MHHRRSLSSMNLWLLLNDGVSVGCAQDERRLSSVVHLL